MAFNLGTFGGALQEAGEGLRNVEDELRKDKEEKRKVRLEEIAAKKTAAAAKLAQEKLKVSQGTLKVAQDKEKRLSGAAGKGLKVTNFAKVTKQLDDILDTNDPLAVGSVKPTKALLKSAMKAFQNAFTERAKVDPDNLPQTADPVSRIAQLNKFAKAADPTIDSVQIRNKNELVTFFNPDPETGVARSETIQLETIGKSKGKRKGKKKSAAPKEQLFDLTDQSAVKAIAQRFAARRGAGAQIGPLFKSKIRKLLRARGLDADKIISASEAAADKQFEQLSAPATAGGAGF